MLFSFLKRALLFFATVFFAGVVIIIGAYLYVAPELPSIEAIKTIRVQTPLRIYTKQGNLFAIYGEKRRTPISFDEIPQQTIDAFLASEDDRFYAHPGVDYAGLLRATYYLIVTGRRTQGGSTITMQLARNFFLTKQRTFERKIKEIYLALIMERLLSKDEILNLYLNKIFFGKRAYGIAAAAEIYYGSSIQDLTLAQNAMLAGLPKAPSTYNPLADPEKALERRSYVLGRMLELNMITDEQYQHAMAMPITAKEHGIKIELEAPYVAEMVRAYMVERYGESAYSDGYDVYTTIDENLQIKAQSSLRKGLLDYDRRHGWRGVKSQVSPEVLDSPEALQKELDALSVVAGLEPAIVSSATTKTMEVILKDGTHLDLPKSGWQWQPYLNPDYRGQSPQNAYDVAGKGDIVRVIDYRDGKRLSQIPIIEGAIVALEPNSGAILALSGGFDFYQSNFNRALQAKRQPGSSFKPFIYAAALMEGYTPASIVKDTPVVFSETLSRLGWRPENYSGKFFGPTRLREALTHSRNMISVKLVDSISLGNMLEYAQRFGFEREDHPYNLTLALGSGVATPLEVARGFSVFANSGFLTTPYFINKIILGTEVIFTVEVPRVCAEGCDGNITEKEETLLEDNVSPIEILLPEKSTQFFPRVIPADTAYQITSMLKSVIRLGTGRRARALDRGDLAGKTGTTNNQRDAWFSGFNRDIVCTVWVGFDNHSPLGNRETGAVAALPIWMDFMSTALSDKAEKAFYKPTNIVTAKIDRKTGLLAHPSDSEAITETFRKNYLPKDIAPAPWKAGREQKLDKLF